MDGGAKMFMGALSQRTGARAKDGDCGGKRQRVVDGLTQTMVTGRETPVTVGSQRFKELRSLTDGQMSATIQDLLAKPMGLPTTPSIHNWTVDHLSAVAVDWRAGPKRGDRKPCGLLPTDGEGSSPHLPHD